MPELAVSAGLRASTASRAPVTDEEQLAGRGE